MGDNAPMQQRTVYFVSDQTGVTAETLGHSLLSQFDGIEFRPVTVPFVNSVDKAKQVAATIDRTAEVEGRKPIVFASLVQEDVRRPLLESQGLVIDFFEAFLAPLEGELHILSSHALGRGHGMADPQRYNQRMEATNYAMTADDGHGVDLYGQADIILLGVSRSGKSPTCLYMALQYGIFAANYPLTEDDLESGQLPALLRPHRDKLYGLTIAPDRLRQIRLERRAVGRYATPQQISFELRAAESLFRRWSIAHIDTTHSSIEEIASTILSETGVERRVHG
jgi:[pyruvate, water dikinase]-phosphate phosphotransferase / [pyruvate, water dikinase] kinase